MTWKKINGRIEVRNWAKKCKAENKKCTSRANKIWVEDVCGFRMIERGV